MKQKRKVSQPGRALDGRTTVYSHRTDTVTADFPPYKCKITREKFQEKQALQRKKDDTTSDNGTNEIHNNAPDEVKA